MIYHLWPELEQFIVQPDGAICSELREICQALMTGSVVSNSASKHPEVCESL
jgi:hypothetical protein